MTGHFTDELLNEIEAELSDGRWHDATFLPGGVGALAVWTGRHLADHTEDLTLRQEQVDGHQFIRLETTAPACGCPHCAPLAVKKRLGRLKDEVCTYCGPCSGVMA